MTGEPGTRQPDLPDETSSRERRLADLLARYSDLEASGETVDPHDFCRSHPELMPDLEAALLTMLSIDCPTQERQHPDTRPLPSISGQDPVHLSGCRILSEIGAGGMGKVFLARDERLDRPVAIKILADRYQAEAAIKARFMSEARALARLSHPNVVRIYGLGRAEEIPHFVMEYVDGVPLIEAARALPLKVKIEILRQVVRAVQYLHEHGIVHRDLKPGNILVGRDLEPKLLDFGLVRHLETAGAGMTIPGDVVGTPEYLAPEQARGERVDGRTDIFALGTVLFELLTGRLPFEGKDLREQIAHICHAEPPLPRSLDGSIPGDLQNICMKALEKDPQERYTSAREMGDDLERFLAGEPVLAAPSSYTRRMAGKVEQHLHELEVWRQNQILSDSEFDALQKRYARLIEPEDAWIMEVRRLSLPQVSLYLGAWLLSVGAALLFLFRYPDFPGIAALLLVGLAAGSIALYGIYCWRSGRLRIAMAYLLALSLLIPTTLLIGIHEAGLFTGLTQGRDDLEFFLQFPELRPATNAQLWWAIALSLPAYIWLRRFTRSSVLSLVLATMAAVLCLVTLLRMGLLEHLPDDQGWMYARMIPAAVLFFASGALLERGGYLRDSRYFYPIGVFFTLVSLSGLAAFHEPYSRWLADVFPWTRGQLEYLFILNAGIYAALQYFAGRLPSAQMRTVAKALRFVIPTHVLTSLLLLGLEATRRLEQPGQGLINTAQLLEARTFELLLPTIAALFVFWSIPKQMKNYLATGLVFLAIGIIRLQQNWFSNRFEWPIILLLLGVALMVVAARYSSIRTALSRWLRK